MQPKRSASKGSLSARGNDCPDSHRQTAAESTFMARITSAWDRPAASLISRMCTAFTSIKHSFLILRQ
ncbi:hypothetical protein [Flavonifractor phage Cormatin]|nr:hypothetical protein [Flavonifractor phage Cormatin]